MTTEPKNPAVVGPLDGAVRPLVLDMGADAVGAELARVLFALGASAGSPCSRIEFKLGTYPNNEWPGGGFAEKPLGEYLARELKRLQRLAYNEPAA